MVFAFIFYLLFIACFVVPFSVRFSVSMDGKRNIIFLSRFFKKNFRKKKGVDSEKNPKKAKKQKTFSLSWKRSLPLLQLPDRGEITVLLPSDWTDTRMVLSTLSQFISFFPVPFRLYVREGNFFIQVNISIKKNLTGIISVLLQTLSVRE